MDKKHPLNKNDFILTGIKSGALGAVLTVVLLLPGAIWVYSGMIPMDKQSLICSITVAVSGVLSQVLFSGKKRGRGLVPYIAISELTFTGVILLISAGIPYNHFQGTKIITLIAVSTAGIAIGALSNFNKSYTPKSRKATKYTKSNHSKKFT